MVAGVAAHGSCKCWLKGWRGLGLDAYFGDKPRSAHDSLCLPFGTACLVHQLVTVSTSTSSRNSSARQMAHIENLNGL